MKVYKNSELNLRRAVIAIGVFDGMHRGHQALIKQAVKRAYQLGVPSVVYTFNPPPRAFFQQKRVLTAVDDKLELIKQLGIDYVIVADFNEVYAARPAAAFITELHELGAEEIFVGPNFHFGKGKTGNTGMLSRHFPVKIQPYVTCQNGEVISSTRVRELLQKEEWKQVHHLLGRHRLETLIFELI
ncbi:FAD synthetase [Bacillus piscicola]|uniref:FAD synthetase n=1 Tax=Bacillus piscicola TaxID=1632684 RepID=UPI001F094430|nr:FAD synthetase [Bacillus piscicola]